MVAVLTAPGMVALSHAQDWSRFRGPNGSGIAVDTGYPVEFSPTRHLLWRSAVRPGKSSPVLSRRHIFLTAFDGGALFTLAPPEIEALSDVADAGEVMPPKTTYFEPKPAAGIFLRL